MVFLQIFGSILLKFEIVGKFQELLFQLRVDGCHDPMEAGVDSTTTHAPSNSPKTLMVVSS